MTGKEDGMFEPDEKIDMNEVKDDVRNFYLIRSYDYTKLWLAKLLYVSLLGLFIFAFMKNQ